jgi:putative hydrolase of HD superfamily
MKFKKSRFDKQIEFILEIDQLKQVFRQTCILDKSRRENSVEHSWHIVVMAIIFSEYADSNEINIFKVVKMLLVHDLVEIDAGDTFCYDERARKNQHEREVKAANRLFKILPVDQSKEFESLWEEFEECKTPSAKFANALDRIQPLINNYYSDGLVWKENGIKSFQIKARYYEIMEIAPKLGQYASELIEKAIQRGILKK